MVDSSSEKATISITLPSWILSAVKLVDYGAKGVVEGVKTVEENVKKPFVDNPFKDKKMPNLNFSKNAQPFKNFFASHKKAALVVLAVLILTGGVFVGAKKLAHKSFAQGGAAQTTPAQNGPKVEINRNFDVPIKTQDGKDSGEVLKVTITTVEKSDKILIQGKPASATNGKTFLIIIIDVQNDTKKQLTVKPVDLVRLLGADGKSYAADVYNNNVSSEPISVLKTKIGYIIDTGQKDFKLLIGEVRDKQEPIQVSF